MSVLAWKRMKKQDNGLESQLFHIGIVFLAAGAGLLAFYIFVLHEKLPGIPCLMLTVFGIYCPGCGGTRALEALMHGKIITALWYHPLIPYTAVLAGGFMLTQGLDRLGVKAVRGWKFHNWYLYGAVIIIICNFLLKNMLRLIWGIEI